MVVFHDIFGIFGFSTQLIYDIIPVIFLCHLKRKESEREKEEKPKGLSIISIICIYFNALIYFVLCAVIKNEIEVMDFCNLQGTYLGIIYIILYYKYLYYPEQKVKFCLIIVSVIFLSSIVVTLEYLLKEKDYFLNAINWIGVIFNIGEYLPIGFSLVYLIKNKISEKFTLYGAFIGIINTSLWLIWAILKTFTTIEIGDDKEKKYHTFIANIIGLLLCLSQIFIFCIYRKDESDERTQSLDLNPKDIESDNATENNNKSRHTDEINDEDLYNK